MCKEEKNPPDFHFQFRPRGSSCTQQQQRVWIVSLFSCINWQWTCSERLSSICLRLSAFLCLPALYESKFSLGTCRLQNPSKTTCLSACIFIFLLALCGVIKDHVVIWARRKLTKESQHIQICQNKILSVKIFVSVRVWAQTMVSSYSGAGLCVATEKPDLIVHPMCLSVTAQGF